jgi:hypothetical protein
MYTRHDVSAIRFTPSSLYCQIRFEKRRRHTGNNEGILATVTINWQQEGYAENKEGHIGNNSGTMARRRAYWQQDGYTDTGGGGGSGNKKHTPTRRAMLTTIIVH